MNQKWYLKTWLICILFAFWWAYGVPLIIGIVLMLLKVKDDNNIRRVLSDNERLLKERETLLNEIGADRYVDVTNKISSMESQLEKKQLDIEEKLSGLNEETAKKDSVLTQLSIEIERLNMENEKLSKQIQTQINKLRKTKELYKSVDYAISSYFNYTPNDAVLKIPNNDLDELESISPSIILKLHCMDIKDLRKAYKENDKLINGLLVQYSNRYTTKANRTIYQLMVLALRAELQNILYNLKYDKLDTSISAVKDFTQKYLKIAADGNQSIAGTITKFIGELEYLFINAVKIEYNYYVKREQAKQEQLAIRQQMREEAEERRLLAQQQKQIEKEEEKYNNELIKLQESLSVAVDESKIAELNTRILELQSQLSDVVIKKEEILKLQNGKAGNVYIISNLGSFGDNIFKIGMTRRINPQERIDELGSASVPFKFDVHSFIFSDNAVDLEKQLHTILNEKRVNKVNLRKEFFRTTIDELEELVTDIEPTAEFNKTMLAEEFNQSLSSDNLYTSENYSDYDDEYEDDEETLI